MDGEAATFDPFARPQVGYRVKSRNELRPAIGITAVIHRINADKYVPGTEHLGPRERIGEEYGIPRRHIGDRDFHLLRRWLTILGDRDIRRQGGAAKGAEIYGDDLVPFGAEGGDDSSRGRQLDLVALSVGKAQGGDG